MPNSVPMTLLGPKAVNVHDHDYDHVVVNVDVNVDVDLIVDGAALEYL